MAAPKPNHITDCNLGQNGDAEYVVACKGRPFSILSSPQLPTPTVNYVDYGLINDLNLRITDLQCRKLFYGGEKLRVLGKVATSVQCIVDGSPIGNIYFKAHVVEDLKKMFNTHGIASEKLRKRFTGPKANKEPTDDISDDEKPNEKERKKKKRKKDKTMKKADSAADDQKPVPVKAEPLTPPRPICQGNWMKIQSYHGWHPEHGYGGPPGVLRDCYQHRDTGETRNERPDCWDSDGSFHSEGSAPAPVFPSSDEYDDIYTNVSTIRHCDDHCSDPPTNRAVTNSAMTAHPPPFLSVEEARKALVGDASAMSSSSPASPNTIVKQMTLNCQRAGMDTASTMHALQCAGIDTSKMAGTYRVDLTTKKIETAKRKKAMISQGKLFTKEDLSHVTTLRREGKTVPASLNHVPSLHGPDWCFADCIFSKVVPEKCGYHESWGSVTACSYECNGGYCDHYQDPDNYYAEDQDDSDFKEQDDGRS